MHVTWSDADRRPATVVATGVPDSDGAVVWLAQRHDEIRAAVLRHGALLIRGLPVFSTGDFAAARDQLIRVPVPYREKATPRSDYGEGVFSSTDLPAMQPIRLHNENSYTLEFPGVLLFGCLVAPATGGATTVADVREVLNRIPQEIRERFRQQGWLLRRNYHSYVGLTWNQAFNTEEESVMAEYCAANDIDFRWREDGGLQTTQRRAAVVRHPRTGEPVWFNHAAFWHELSLDEETREVLVETYGADGLPFSTCYGDGSPISPDDLRAVNQAYAEAERRDDWQVGDLLLVDNVMAAHGREAFTGDRKIVVAMGEPVALRDCDPSTPWRTPAGTAGR